MKNFRRYLYFSFILCTLCTYFVLYIPSSRKQTAFGYENIMGIDEIKPGMHGYGKTVFSGNRIEIFNVEILGVLKNWKTKSDLILIKMSGGPLEKTGIIAGMSGSPVYINNRLIGAVAYGWSFSKDAIAGVLPISEMQKTLLYKSEQEEGTLLPYEKWSLAPGTENEHNVSPQTPLLRLQAGQIFNEANNHIQPVPILSPFVVSGFAGEAVQKMKPFLSSCGLYPVQGGTYTSSESTKKPTPLVPGSSVAAVLIKGDLNAAVVGTVTYTKGNNVLAFGHPFLHLGSTDIPMASAYVYTILSSQSNSVKMASPGEVVGRIYQDRRQGIAGVIGEHSRMIPCNIEVEGTDNLNYAFEVADNKLLTPAIVLMAAQSSVMSTEKKLGEKSVHVQLLAHIDGYDDPLKIENVYYEINQSWTSLNHIAHLFAMVLNNQFKEVRINKLEVGIKVLNSRQTAHVETIEVNKKQVQPGDELQVNVTLMPYMGKRIYKKVRLSIPEDVLPGNPLKITACDASQSQSLNMSRAAGKHLPTNFDQLLHYVKNMEQNNNLVVRVLLPKRGLTYKGEGLPSLPSSIFSVVSHAKKSGTGPLYDEIITRIPTSYVLKGKQSIDILVQ